MRWREKLKTLSVTKFRAAEAIFSKLDRPTKH